MDRLYLFIFKLFIFIALASWLYGCGNRRGDRFKRSETGIWYAGLNSRFNDGYIYDIHSNIKNYLKENLGWNIKNYTQKLSNLDTCIYFEENPILYDGGKYYGLTLNGGIDIHIQTLDFNRLYNTALGHEFIHSIEDRLKETVYDEDRKPILHYEDGRWQAETYVKEKLRKEDTRNEF